MKFVPSPIRGYIGIKPKVTNKVVKISDHLDELRREMYLIEDHAADNLQSLKTSDQADCYFQGPGISYDKALETLREANWCLGKFLEGGELLPKVYLNVVTLPSLPAPSGQIQEVGYRKFIVSGETKIS